MSRRALILLPEPPGCRRRCPRSLPRAARSCCSPGLPLFPLVLPRSGCPFSSPHRLSPAAARCLSLQLGRGASAAAPRCFSPHFLVPVKGPGAAAQRFSLPLLPSFLPPHLSLHWQSRCALGRGSAGGPRGAAEQRSGRQGGIMGTVPPWVLLLLPPLPAPTAGLCCISAPRCPHPSPRCRSCVSPTPGPVLSALLVGL